jgi:hypothetical protein
VKLRRLRIATCALVLALGLAACGHKQAHPSVADANNNGGYVDAGPITYQLQISRELNPYSTEDSQYVKGLPPGTVGPTANQLWYGVFLWAKNQTSEPQTTSDSFVISDTQGNHYYPIKVDPDINEFAWTAQTLKPLNTEPGPDTVGADGPTQGGLILFKLDSAVYANRPLTFYILGPDGRRQASISLNL